MEQQTKSRIDYTNVAIIAIACFVIGVITAYILFGNPFANGYMERQGLGAWDYQTVKISTLNTTFAEVINITERANGTILNGTVVETSE